MDDVSLVYIDGRYVDGAKKLVTIASERKVPVVLEAERTGYGVQELLPDADVVITSSQFHDEYFGGRHYEHNLRTLLEQGAALAIVTLGSGGSIAKTLDEVIEVPAPPCTVVDSTGAGDAYIGGFLYAHLTGCDLKKSMEFASAVAGRNCEQIGAQKGLPTLEQVESLLL